MAKASPSSMLVPGDYQTEQDSIKRRRDMLDALVQRSQYGDGQMVSGHYVAPHWTQALADLGANYAKIKGNKDLDEESANAKDQYQKGLGTAVEDYLKTKNGYDRSTPLTQVTADGSEGAPVLEKVAGDPRAAMIKAMTSQYAPLQQVGAAELGQMGKQVMTPKDIYALAGENKYTPASVQQAALAGDTSLLKPMGKAHVVNGQLIEAGADTDARTLGDYRDKFGTVGAVGVGPNGQPIMGQTNTSTGEAKFAPSGTTVNVDTGKKGADAFAVKLGEANVKRLEDSTAAAQKSQASLQSFQNAAQLVQDMPGGIAAAPIQNVKRVLAAFGVDDPSIASNEQAIAALKQGILENAKTLGSGSGFTNQDYNELAKIVGADPALSPATLKYAINKGLAGSINTLRNHEKLVSKMQGIDGASAETLEPFKVAIPHFSLNGDDFDFDDASKMLIAKGSGARKTAAATAAQPNGKAPLTAAEKDELARLRQQLGIQ